MRLFAQTIFLCRLDNYRLENPQPKVYALYLPCSIHKRIHLGALISSAVGLGFYASPSEQVLQGVSSQPAMKEMEIITH